MPAHIWHVLYRAFDLQRNGESLSRVRFQSHVVMQKILCANGAITKMSYKSKKWPIDIRTIGTNLKFRNRLEAAFLILAHIP